MQPKKGLLQENSVVYRDLFDTKLMNCLMPRPSEVTKTFWEKYQVSPETATDYYYNLSRNSDYIRRYRVSKDMKWTTDTKYGTLDITVNLSKPEKDPKAIAAAKLAKQSGYPKCQLCMENIGYAGRVNHPAEITIVSYRSPLMTASGDFSIHLMFTIMSTVSCSMASISQ